ncbi:MAG: magnesium transporter [Candidatus Korobacteraceae bacterium]
MATVLNQDNFVELIQLRRWSELRSTLSELHPSDIAELLIDLPESEEAVVFRLLPRDQAAEVFSYLPSDHQEHLIQSLSNDLVRSVLEQMSPDDRTRLLEELPFEVARRLLESLPPTELTYARQLLGYPEDTAGRFMTPEYVSVRPEMSAGAALEFIRSTGKGKEMLDVIYIVDTSGKLVGDVGLPELVLAPPATRVVDLIEPLVSIPATADREEVLAMFEKYDRIALPVTDTLGNMLGIITVDDVLDVAEEEATEDFQKIGGTEALDAPYAQTSVWSLLRKRGGWLSVLFIGEMLTATAMGRFEDEIASAVVLALFVPLIISSGGNSGSQAATLIIRALAIQELTLGDWFRVLRRELLSGLALGSFLGMMGFVRIVLWQELHITNYGDHFLLLAVTVCASLIGVVLFGTVAGSMLPFILRRVGFDPATSSAPFIATLVDVTGLVIYFTVALLILRGTLL